MMKKQTHKVSLLVYIKNKYKYGHQEEKLGVLAYGLGGKEIGGGTDLDTGKRDKQYYFKNRQDAEIFLNYPTVKQIILKEYDLVDIDKHGLTIVK